MTLLLSAWGVAVEASFLHEAAKRGDVEGVKGFLKAFPNTVESISDDGTALHFAALAGKVEVAKVLVDAHADVDAETKHGVTPLHSAVYGGQLEMVRFLLSVGANAKSKTDQGVTPLDLATTKGYTEIVDLLQKAIADPTGIREQLRREQVLADQSVQSQASTNSASDPPVSGEPVTSLSQPGTATKDSAGGTGLTARTTGIETSSYDSELMPAVKLTALVAGITLGIPLCAVLLRFIFQRPAVADGKEQVFAVDAHGQLIRASTTRSGPNGSLIYCSLVACLGLAFLGGPGLLMVHGTTSGEFAKMCGHLCLALGWIAFAMWSWFAWKEAMNYVGILGPVYQLVESIHRKRWLFNLIVAVTTLVSFAAIIANILRMAEKVSSDNSAFLGIFLVIVLIAWCFVMYHSTYAAASLVLVAGAVISFFCELMLLAGEISMAIIAVSLLPVIGAIFVGFKISDRLK